MMEALKRPYPEPHHRFLPSQPASGDSTAEAAVHRKATMVFPEEEAQQDEADQTGMVEKPQLGPVVPALVNWDSQAGADHLDQPGKAVFVQMDQEPDRSRAEEGPPEEEGEVQDLGPAAESTSGERQAPVSEPGQSTDLLLSAPVTPTSKPGKESEMLEEVSEPVRPDRRNREIRLPVSYLFDLAWEKLLNQDRARPIDQVQASTVMENSSVTAQVEFCSSVERSRRDQALKEEE